tara:strand:+ start:760 stop:1881 length:1122 start_codon:yes stop_codon:yes gene_type:complete
MLTKDINFKNFLIKSDNRKINKELKLIINKSSQIIKSLSNDYKLSYTKSFINKYKKLNNINLIGIGGSILGTKAIHDFLINKVKKNFYFTDNLCSSLDKKIPGKRLNIIISKSGNTLETLTNTKFILKKKDKNIIITQKHGNNLRKFAEKLKSEIVEHNNYIGGRYSVLSEVGMLPSELMGLNVKRFKNFNNLIKNKEYLNNLINNVSNTLSLYKSGKNISIILNYDEKSDSLFRWYQQLLAESLGKKSKGILPVISTMPKDNHSLMQLYLDGPRKSFYTFFQVIEKKNINKKIQNILYLQRLATENVFKKKNIPFRSFEIRNRNEESLGALFSFFILETILLGRALNVNPFDQPSVELIKDETKKLITKNNF